MTFWQLGGMAVLAFITIGLWLIPKVTSRIDRSIREHRREWVKRHRTRPDSRDTLAAFRRINGAR